MNGNLVLSRLVGETIHIGPDIVLTVIRFEGKKVKLSIQAPKEIPILRGEIFELINRGKATDALSSGKGQ